MGAVRVSALTFAMMLECLMHKEGVTCKEIAKETGLHYTTVLIYTKMLWKRKIIHIAGWCEDSRGRKQKKLYAFSYGAIKRDVKKPPKQTVEEKNRINRERYRAKRMIEMTAGRIV
jgi:predicted transcriptional regulator